MVALPFHPLEVRDGEQKVHRLFALNLASHHIPAFTRPKRNSAGGDDYPLRDALGLNALDAQFVQILKLADLGEMKLTEYMEDGLGIPPGDLEDHAERLNALEGHLAVISAPAFQTPAVITPKPPVSLVGAFAEHEAMRDYVDLSTTNAAEQVQLRESPPAVPRDSGAWQRWLWPCIGVAVIALAVYYLFFAKGAS